MFWLFLACSPDPLPTDSGHTGAPLPTDCVADLTDGAAASPRFGQANGEVVFRDLSGYAWLSGAFLDGPEVRSQVETEREGACRLLEYAPSTCDPGCSGTQLCRDSVCVDLPRRVAAGTLTLTGPLELTAEPDGIKGYFVDSEAEVEATAPLRLTGTDGPDVPQFEARTCPVTAPRRVGDWDAALADRSPGADVTLRWSNPLPEARIRLRMTTGVATHGGISPAELECEASDTGELTLPGRFLDALYAEGWACGECGNNDLVRYRSGTIGETSTAFTSESVTTFYHIPR
jgi:hypothetical protein